MNLTPPPPSQNSHAVRWSCRCCWDPSCQGLIIIILIPQVVKIPGVKNYKS